MSNDQEGIDEGGVDGVTLDPTKLPAEFVFFKGAYHHTKDSRVDQYVAAAQAMGIPFGLYHFPDQHAPIGPQFEAFAAVSDSYTPGGLKVGNPKAAKRLRNVYDLERLDEVKDKDGNVIVKPVTPAVAVENARDWGVRQLARTGNKAFLYWSYRVWYEVLRRADCSALVPLYDTWLAHENTEMPPGWDAPFFLQYAFDKKGEPGVSGDGHADRDRFSMVGPWSKGSIVATVQTKLGLFSDQCPAGVWTLATEVAVRAFQAARGLGVTGVVDVETFAALDWCPVAAPAQKAA